MNSTDALALRFTIADRLAQLRYGDSYCIPPEHVQTAYKPTGDYDTSFEGAFHALALMAGGHRSETSYTSLERVQNDLPDDGSYIVREQAMDGSIVVSRRLDACPRCHGSGVFRRISPALATQFHSWPEASPTENTALVGAHEGNNDIAVETVCCDHRPQTALKARQVQKEEEGG